MESDFFFTKPPLNLILLVLLLSFSPQLALADQMRSPFQLFERKISRENLETSSVKFVLKGLVSFYSKFISPADGPRSPSYPTGSAYAQEVIEEYGFFPGVILISDRLLHESDVHIGQKIYIFGRERYYDPPENNTFWWDKASIK